MKKKRILQLVFLLFLIVGTVWVIYNNKQQENMPFQKSEGTIFGTFYHATYQYSRDLTPEIEAELGKVDASLSPFNPKSIITAINQNRPVELDDMFTHVFQLSEEVSKQTGGAFDITVAPLVNAWGFGFKHNVGVSRHDIDSLLQFVGYQKVKLVDGKIIKQDPRTMLDCSAVAKGFGSDVVARFFESKGIKNYMIEIGGEIVVHGTNAQHDPWKIGVIRPTDDSTAEKQDLQNILDISNIGMATSGNYRNFYYKDGKKYAHTIDPHTGMTVQHSILSSTVIAPNCATADAYATSFMVLGLEKAKAVLARHSELQAYFIYTDAKGKYATWYSPSLKQMLEK